MKTPNDQTLGFDSIDLKYKSVYLLFKSQYYIPNKSIVALKAFNKKHIVAFINQFFADLREWEDAEYDFAKSFMSYLYYNLGNKATDTELNNLYNLLQIVILTCLPNTTGTSDTIKVMYSNGQLLFEKEKVSQFNIVTEKTLDDIITTFTAAEGSHLWTLLDNRVKIIWL
jgi:hypothetical protein